jgi:hypothetical protein
MLKIFSFTVLLAVLPLGEVSARVIYGEEHRVEVSEATKLQQKLASAAATLIAESKLSFDRPGFVQVAQETMSEWLSSPDKSKSEIHFSSPKFSNNKKIVNFCEDERFTDQPNAGLCSGFLIAPDLIVTAGHCTEEENFCSGFRWIFGYELNPETKKAGIDVKAEDVYKCKKVISNALQVSVRLDYAIVQLDRPVTNREPLEFRFEGKVEDNTPLVIIGSPSGLPLKVAAGANVRSNQQPSFFSANLDSFQGNSGSAVFDAFTGLVEGILVQGESDFNFNPTLGCVESNKCANDGCRGEDVSRMTTIPEVAVKSMLNRAARSGDMESLNKILKLNFWVDFYGKDGVSALMSAVVGGKNNAARALIARGAQVNLQDAKGNSPLHYNANQLNENTRDVLNTLIESKANIELKNKKGETPLSKAAVSLNLIGAKLLIAKGAQKNTRNLNGETVLFAFARQRNAKAVKELMALGVDAKIKNNDGLTVFDLRDNNGQRFIRKTLFGIR